MYRLILLTLLPIVTYAQQEQQWIQKLESTENYRYKLDTTNYKNDFSEIDFSELLIPRDEFIGYIGDGFKRIQIEFTSIRKDTRINNYVIIGNSIVDSNKCDFQGAVVIERINNYKSLHLGVDSIYKDSNIVKQGILIGRYHIKEDSTQRFSGGFEGIITLYGI